MRQTILHVFNSSLISGPETLVMPALARSGWPVHILLLRESRVSDEKQKHVDDHPLSLSVPRPTASPVNGTAPTLATIGKILL